MEWLLASVLIPIVVWLYTVYRDRLADNKENDERFSDLETRLSVVETKLETIERDVTEIKKLSEKIEQIQMDLVKVLTLLEERTNKGQ
ncbi:hypothetical protein ACRAOD_17330 [Raoultella ornithinolytica]|uniref:hypothetical protein n=1 Tax=Enterobacterales TaxID=91347 RepID=UPI0021BA4FD6|nr:MULTISPECIES: hypothetical protein [Enterobacterales]MCT8171721.1 hypothetical protein [Raoultella ornithinolytica]UXO67305.1 hypothetical protein N7977_12560 [Pantoea dispersa]WPO20331.1 hypothetical protein SH579_05170 [Raoultella ornithinolytica]